ncbi:acyltransferase family protein [Methylobacterium sp. E-045]|uniref:acyltransferase family protein n=1 Tax=Methylobacterium sp. E-045 TaxID=2836575 RepID=UPI001FB8E017|nr:acyltransferase [Methylobacterium sp. E-045]MCJ2130938.1 acyltransferase [Methylobacterium sp. E-045]
MKHAGTPTLTVLQGGRAVAALAVVAFHSAIATRDFGQGLPDAVFRASGYGAFGVDFFFVLSGFIILFAHAGDARDSQTARTYVWKRLARIYVPYLPVSLGLIGIYLALPRLSGSTREWSLLTSLTLIPTGLPPALAVAWTLVHEMMFYGLFLVSYVIRRFAWLVAGWVVLILAAAPWGMGETGNVPSAWSFLAPINLDFVLGMLAAHAVWLLNLRGAWVVLCIGLGVLGAAVAFSPPDPGGLHRLPHGIGLACIVAGAVRFEQVGLIRAPLFLVGLGNASYAIYLVHNPIASLAARMAARLGAFAAWPLCLAFCIGCGVVVGLFYHYAVERPALDRVRRRLGQVRTSVAVMRRPDPA